MLIILEEKKLEICCPYKTNRSIMRELKKYMLKQRLENGSVVILMFNIRSCT